MAPVVCCTFMVHFSHIAKIQQYFSNLVDILLLFIFGGIQLAHGHTALMCLEMKRLFLFSMRSHHIIFTLSDYQTTNFPLIPGL